MDEWKGINLAAEELSECSDLEPVPINSPSSFFPERSRKSILSKSSVGVTGGSANDLSFHELNDELGAKY
jgi:hypothetical protein